MLKLGFFIKAKAYVVPAERDPGASPYVRYLRILLLVFLLLGIHPRPVWLASADARPAVCDFTASNESSFDLAIGCANTAGLGTYTITLTNDILLTQPSPVLTNPDATQIVIEGNGHAINANNHGRVLTIQSIQNLVLRNLTLTGGYIDSSGGGLSLDCEANIDCTWTLQNTVVRNNGASSGGGINYYCGDGSGGALIIQNSVIRSNVASGEGGGILYSSDEYSGACSVTLRNTVIVGNQAVDGGAMRIYRPRVSIIDSMIRNNVATQTGGGFMLNIHDGFIDMLMQNSTVSGNEAGVSGGGLFVKSTDQLFDIKLINSTISNNKVSNGTGGGLYLYENSGSLRITLLNSTVTQNTAQQGAGVHIFDEVSVPASYYTTTVRLGNSIIADNPGGDCGAQTADGLPFTGQRALSYGHNLDSDGSCLSVAVRQPNDIPNGQAKLGSLADNGGPTLTHILLPGSAALDAGDNAVCAAEPVNGLDQRGVHRPQNGICDIGAVEIIPNPPTPTSTPTVTPPSIETPPTATPTATTTPTTDNSTPTPTFTPTATSLPPNGVSEGYEPDNTCAQAKTIGTEGDSQMHSFQQQADVDWVRFDAIANTKYLIQVETPPESPADVILELYNTCAGLPTTGQDYAFSPGVHLSFTALATGPVFLKLLNHTPSVAGDQVRYELTVHAENKTAQVGALILVAGGLQNDDEVQPNIYHVTDAVYQLFVNHNYPPDNILYLAPDRSHPHVTALASAAALQSAITTWALTRVDQNRSLTLYLMDHGGKDIFYLDKQHSEWVTPAQLDDWLHQVEMLRPGIKVNVIIEACYSGSFITLPQSISRSGRAVLTSATDTGLAWASATGAYFSDYLVAALDRQESFDTSFRQASGAAHIFNPGQTAWLDANGDGIIDDAEDRVIAGQRGFAYPGTLTDEMWPPYIAHVDTPVDVVDQRGLLRANVLDDVSVQHVWAVIYPPSYVAPSNSEALVQESLPTLKLLDQGKNIYAATFDGFRESGPYRIVLYAEDNQGLTARPVAITVNIGNRVFLPLVNR